MHVLGEGGVLYEKFFVFFLLTLVPAVSVLRQQVFPLPKQLLPLPLQLLPLIPNLLEFFH